MDLDRPGAPTPSRPALPLCRLALGPLVLALAACAAISERPVNQEVHLSATSDGAPVEAACEVGNDRGRWTVIAPVRVAVTRSPEPLTVDCVDGEGRQARHVAAPSRSAGIAAGGVAGYEYPSPLTLPLAAVPVEPTSSLLVASAARTPIDDVARLPAVDEAGRDGYRRFLAGPSPRAFAIADGGTWIRVNGSRGADRLALARCQAAGSACRLYAIDDQVVWEQRRTPDLLAGTP